MPYKARVLHGTLTWQLLQHTSVQPPEFQLTVRNRFAVPVLFTAATVEDPYYRVEHFSPHVLASETEATIATVHGIPGAQAIYSTALVVHNNATELRAPLQVSSWSQPLRLCFPLKFI